MNGIRPTVGIEFDDKYTNAKNKLLDFFVIIRAIKL